jgi:hypothetical protein
MLSMSVPSLLFLFLLLMSFTCFGQFSAEQWKYRQEIVVDNTNSNLPLVDHQVNFLWNTERLLKQEKIAENGNDIRITDSDGKTLLCFWIENEIGQRETKIWCKIPYLEAGEVKTIYLFYGFQGEETPLSAANAHCTFYLFDDFTGHRLDTTKWSTIGSGHVRIAKGKAFIQSENTDMILRSKKAFSMPVIAEMQLTTRNGKYVSFALVQEKNSYEGYALALDHPQEIMKLSYLDPEWFSPCGGYGFMPDFNNKSAGATEGIWSIASITANTIMGSWAGGSLLAENVIILQEKVNLALGTLACQNGQHAAMEVDWVRVRNLALNPPQIWIGSEHLTDDAPFSDAPVHAPEI